MLGTFVPATTWLQQIMLPRLQLATVQAEDRRKFLDYVLEKVDQSFPEVCSGTSAAKGRPGCERLEGAINDVMEGLKDEGVLIPLQAFRHPAHRAQHRGDSSAAGAALSTMRSHNPLMTF